MRPPEPNLKAIFAAALERPVGPERSSYLDQVCGVAGPLRLQVDALLRAHAGAGQFLDSAADPAAATRAADFVLAPAAPDPVDATLDQPLPPGPTVAASSPTLVEGPGTTIGPYKLLQIIGEGGMGTVFMAEQEKPIRRKVALKVIKQGMDTRQVVARFEAERQALALMDHPHIARVLDAGATATGRPYFVMELVRGVPITEYCDRNHLTPRERLELFIPVCQAIQHAHQKGIIHRDIKPNNVLVTLYEGKPEAKVIDFGVAKATEQRLTERTMFTEFGAIIGTLEYMSPEQAEMGALDIDTRSDIYSLGVLLYELLTGSTPLDKARLRQAAYSEILRRIREEEPSKPSTKLSESQDALPSISAQRRTEPARLSKLMRGDLDWIVMKSLDKDRTRRYETANGFARDIQRYLDGDAVEASPPSARYKLGKFARKHRGALATAGAFALLLIAATAVSAGLAFWANKERVRADRARLAATAAEAEAKTQRDLAQDRERVANVERARAVKAEELTRAEQARVLSREEEAIAAVKRFADVVREVPELQNNPGLAPLRKTLLKAPQAFFARLKDRLQGDPQTTAESLQKLGMALAELGELTLAIGDQEEALRIFDQCMGIYQRMAREYPSMTAAQSNLVMSHLRISSIMLETGRTADGLALLERGRSIAEQLVRDHPENGQLRNTFVESEMQLALAYADSSRLTEAMTLLDRTLNSIDDLIRSNPSNPTKLLTLKYLVISNSASVMHRLNRLDDALASYQKALLIFNTLPAEGPVASDVKSLINPPTFAVCIGLILRGMRREAEALASYNQGRAMFERLVSDHPSVNLFQERLADCEMQIGALQFEMGLPGPANQAIDRARVLLEKLVRDNPSVVKSQRMLAGALASIAQLSDPVRHPVEAIANYERARVALEKLVQDDPLDGQSPKILFELFDRMVTPYFELGASLNAGNQLVESLKAYEHAHEYAERVVQMSGANPAKVIRLGGCLSNIADVEIKLRRFEEARGHLIRAIEWQRKALATDPNNSQSRQFLGNHLILMSRVAEGLGRLDERDQAQRDLAELDATDPAKTALNTRLAAILKGELPNDNAERLALAQQAYKRSLYATSARLYSEALASDSKLATEPGAYHLYYAACAAAAAGSGRGKDEPPPDAAAWAGLRRQALDWLRSELADRTRMLDEAAAANQPEVAKMMNYWKNDSALAGVRDEKALAKLPEAERADFAKLWANVDALLARAQAAAAPTGAAKP